MSGSRFTDDRGAVTVEAAIALAALVAAIILCLGALLAASTQVRCVDAAREAARLTARGDRAHAQSAAEQIAPPNANITIRREGDHIVATVSSHTPLLPSLVLQATALATVEPGAAP